jgi:hypothetical protein
LKMKCTPYGLYEQATFKNARAILVFEVGRNGHGAWTSFGQGKRCARGGGQPWADVI